MQQKQLVGLVLVATVLLAPVALGEATVVEHRLEKVYADEPMEGTIYFQIGNETKEVDFDVNSGEEIKGFARFNGEDLLDHQQLLVTNTAGRVLLYANTTHRLGQFVAEGTGFDEDRLSMRVEDQSVRLVVGSITGNFQVETVFRSEAIASDATVRLGLDSDGDGHVEPTDVREIRPDGRTSTQSVMASGVPSTSAWSLEITSGGSRLIALEGEVDWFTGGILHYSETERAEVIEEHLETIRFRPTRDSMAGIHPIPNSLFVREIEREDTPLPFTDTALELQFGDPTDTERSDEDSTNSTAIGQVRGQVSNAASSPWTPWIVTLILLSAALLIALGLLVVKNRAKAKSRRVNVIDFR